MLNYDEDVYEKSLKPRTVRCLQEPNPLEHQSWDDPGIEDLLVPERTTTTNADGRYCFTAHLGLWRVTADLLPEEEQAGYTFQYGADRGELAFIMEEGVPNHVIRQANSTASGIVKCLN